MASRNPLFLLLCVLLTLSGEVLANLPKAPSSTQREKLEKWIKGVGDEYYAKYKPDSKLYVAGDKDADGDSAPLSLSVSPPKTSSKDKKESSKDKDKKEKTNKKKKKSKKPKKSKSKKSKSKSIVVAKDGSGKFRTVQDAVDSVDEHNEKRVVIRIKKGIYREKVTIPSNKPYITFQGDGRHLTTIEWNDTASTLGADKQNLSTYGSASVAVNSDHFVAKGINFKNTAPAPPPGAVGQQAVALRVTGDKAYFSGCGFYGAQDTLYDHRGRHYFKNCYIEGSIDFIFGDGQSIYQSCHLHAIAETFGSLTAQKRLTKNEKTGFSFIDCLIDGSGILYLGRAWGPYSRVVYSFCYIDVIVTPGGWYNWGVPGREKTVYYGEYKCSGPGSNSTSWPSWARILTKKEAAPFLSLDFIGGNWPKKI